MMIRQWPNGSPISAGTAGTSRFLMIRLRRPSTPYPVSLPNSSSRNETRETDGFDILEACKESHLNTAVLMIAAFESVELALKAMQSGAFDYVTKPFKGDELQFCIQRALEHQTALRRSDAFRRCRPINLKIVGTSAKMQSIYRLIGKVAATALSIPSRGTGDRQELRPAHSIATARGSIIRSSRSTAARFRTTCWSQSCSATRRALPARSWTKSAYTKSNNGTPFWTKSTQCPSNCKPSCFGSGGASNPPGR